MIVAADPRYEREIYHDHGNPAPVADEAVVLAPVVEAVVLAPVVLAPVVLAPVVLAPVARRAPP
jgi:hypothetical protein